ncbi:MAG TPA: PHP domain-containing protein [Cryptosporangiaceae bacterium]|nr:PHP domain-containing protein [Cryptosporangiaceae bacterium]
MRIDLHTHSTASDGTTSPADLVREAAAVGLDVVALTDHDTTAGWAGAVAALPAGLTLVPGAELSCRWYGPDGVSTGLHLLAYLFDPVEPTFAAERDRVRRSRLARAETMVGMLAADGAGVTWDDVLRIADGGAVGRPHVARALVAAGVVRDVPSAFASEWLGSRYRVRKYDTEVFEAVRLVRDAGGVAVFAHPKASRRGRIVPDALIADLAEAGVAGLEVDHADHDAAERAALRGLARELGLFTTGSSDFHGTNKQVCLGDNATTTAEVYEQLVAAASGGEPATAV